MQAMLQSSYLSGLSAAYIEELYEQYLQNPAAVPSDWRQYFENLPVTTDKNRTEIAHSRIRAQFLELAKNKAAAAAAQIEQGIGTDVAKLRKQFNVLHLIDAYRKHGHHRANLDPLNLAKRLEIADLNLSYHHLSEADNQTKFDTNSFAGLGTHSTLNELYETLNQTYCGTLGVEFMHITNPDEVHWIQERVEKIKGKPQFSTKEKECILQQLTEAEGLEKYLGTKFVGQKRFSLEGGDSLIPLMDQIILGAGRGSLKEIVIGMAHRGRLNVLVNILGKAPKDLFAEFVGKDYDELYSGDVKYHMGFSSDVESNGSVVHLALAFNPSHLEIIDPVVEGSVRARQARRKDFDRNEVLPILIHGDAAFAGQGVVMETFSLSQARGFRTGGTIHVIINNQIGFTTSNPLDARSTLYCTDVAKMVQAPIFHVNGDDPEMVVFITQLALEYRMQYKKDVVIDLVCYRRHGHNEADEPTATQPIMYSKIRKHPTTRKIYADKLIKEGIITEKDAQALAKNYQDLLDRGHTVVEVVEELESPFVVDWSPYQGQAWDAPVNTRVNKKQLQELGKAITTLPAGFVLQKQVEKIMQARLQMINGKQALDWGYAETLAYASLIHEGYLVRLVGQDSRRGTFAHRHATLHDVKNGDECTPLDQLFPNERRFTIIDSLLSEEAVLAFEYGFSSANPHNLVIWEAQFGDFVNGAQVVIDQFISSGEQKWGRLCGLVMLLPHGFEGQGPEHSSARLERFMQLCAQQNIQVCIPSTPAQAFHMLRRQMIRPYRKPLIVMTPKSLLRHKLAVSSLDEIAEGSFQLVISEMDDLNYKKVERVVMCSGKVYYDLLLKRREEKLDSVAIIRIEQLYPFPIKALTEELARYQHVRDVIWCQEEPKNQGTWYCAQHWFRNCLAEGQRLSYAGRRSSASPAVGNPGLHAQQQKALVEQALHG